MVVVDEDRPTPGPATAIPGEELFFQSIQGALPLVLFIVVMIAHKQ